MEFVQSPNRLTLPYRSIEAQPGSFIEVENPIGVSEGPDSRPAFQFFWHGHPVGALEIRADGLHFVGDTDASARVLFKVLAEKMGIEYREEGSSWP